MANEIKTPDELKAYFKNGAKPTDEEFGYLVDALFNVSNEVTLEKAGQGDAEDGTDNDLYMTPLATKNAIIACMRLGIQGDLRIDIQGLIQHVFDILIVDGAPEALDSLEELAAALEGQSDFHTYINNKLALKADKSHIHDDRYYTRTYIDNLPSGASSDMFLCGNIKDYLIEKYLGTIPDAFVKRTSATSYVARLTHNLGYQNYQVFLNPVSQQYTAYSNEPHVHIDKQNNHCDIEMRWRHQSSSGASWSTYDALKEGVEVCIIGDPSRANNLNDNLSTITVDNTNNVVEPAFPINIGGGLELNYDADNKIVMIDGVINLNYYSSPAWLTDELEIALIPEEYRSNSAIPKTLYQGAGNYYYFTITMNTNSGIILLERSDIPDTTNNDIDVPISETYTLP